MKRHTTNKAQRIGMAIALMSFMATSAGALSKAENDVFYVLAGSAPVEITAARLLANDVLQSTSVEVTQPLHGELSSLPGKAGTWYYEPASDFWVVGTDSFTYTVFIGGQPVASATVQLVAMLHGFATTVQTFESEDEDFGDLEVVPGDPIEILPGAAIGGAFGMRVSTATQDVYARLVIDEGGGDDGEDSGGCEVDLRTPGGRASRLLEGETIEVLAIGPEDGTPGIRVLMKREGSQLYIGAEMPYRQDPPAWVAVEEGPHEILLDWWKSEVSGTHDGMVLVIDDVVGQQEEQIAIDGVVMSEYRFGLMSLPSAVITHLDFDNIVVRTGDSNSPLSTLMLADNFEEGISTGWAGVPLSLVPTQSGAQTGAAGLEIPLDTRESMFLVQQLFQAMPQYNVRFRIDPNSLLTSTSLVVLDAFAGLGAEDSPLLRLYLESAGVDSYGVQVEVAGYGVTEEVQIADASSVIELQWRAATSSTSEDGGLVLWVDGSFATGLAHLANSADVLRTVRFGAIGSQAGVGVLLLDDFESWTGEGPYQATSSAE